MNETHSYINNLHEMATRLVVGGQKSRSRQSVTEFDIIVKYRTEVNKLLK